MNRYFRTAIGFLCVLAIVTGLCKPASAYFERLFVSSRAFALGGAFVAIADDPGAVIINSAGLAQISTPTFLSSVSRPYELSDLLENYVAAAVPTRFGTVGLSWHRFGLEDVAGEDLFSIAIGTDYIRNSQDASLSFGGSLDIARVGYASGYGDAKTVVTGSVGVLLRPFPVIGIGYSIHNLGQPSFDWIAADGKTNLKMTQAFGLAYYWQRRVVFSLERAMGQDGRWWSALGIEVNTSDALRLRGGLNAGDVTGGLGVTIAPITLDAGVTAHDVLGLTYYISLGVALPKKSTGGYPGE